MKNYMLTPVNFSYLCLTVLHIPYTQIVSSIQILKWGNKKYLEILHVGMEFV